MDIEKTIKNLKARHFSVQHFASGEEACKYLLGEIKDTSVGIGGSKTVDQLGLYDKLVANGNEVFWHWREPGLETLDKENAAKVFISSANAIAETGEIINIDGRGNRLAGQVYGARPFISLPERTRSAPTSSRRFSVHATPPPCRTASVFLRKRPARSTISATTAARRSVCATRCSSCGVR